MVFWDNRREEAAAIQQSNQFWSMEIDGRMKWVHQLGVFALFQTEPPIQSFRALKIVLWDDRREEIVAKQRSHGWVFMETEEND